jgi:hypothetical protein
VECESAKKVNNSLIVSRWMLGDMTMKILNDKC